MSSTFRGSGDGRLDAAVMAVAGAVPDRPAVADRTGELTYADLARASGEVAARLRDGGVKPGSVVAVSLTPRADTIAVLLGILEAGACYLPLNVEGPAERNRFILGDTRPAALVENADEPLWRGEAGRPLTAATRFTVLDDRDGAAPELSPDTAYLIYTSGTTGRPKGTPVSHANVLALFAATDGLFDFDRDDRWLLFHSLAFDFSVWEVWGPLLYGGRLYVPDRLAVRDPDECAELIRRQGITVLNQTPTAFGVLAPLLAEEPAGHRLRYVIFGGERLRPAELRGWAEAHRDAPGAAAPTLVNMYGITETTVHATHHQVTAADLAGAESVIGRPLPGFTARVVDGAGADAARGELWLAGPQVSGGYLDRPDLTATRFVRHGGRVFYRTGDLVDSDPDGTLRYLGRIDDQVKVRGHRVELGEIEAAALAAPGVSGALVALFALAGQEALACAYTGDPVPDQVLRAHLRERLPEYMVPVRYLRLDRLPRTPNGKADRAAVGRLAESRA